MKSAITNKLLFCIPIIAALCPAQTTIPQLKHKLLLADEGNGKIHYIDLNNPAGKWSATCSNRDMQLIGNDRLLVSDNGGSGFSILSLSTGAVVKHVAVSGVNGGINSAFLKSGGEFYYTRDGSPAKIYKTDSTGKTLSTITLAVDASVRICRPTPAGSFLVGGKVSGMLYEFDADGKKIWECNAGGEPYMGLRLPDGKTLISNGYGGQMVLADEQGAVIRKFPAESDRKSDAQFWNAANPNFFGGFQVLANGNIIVANWQGHGAGHGASGYQLIEIDSALNRVAACWKQDASLVSSLHGVLVLDDLDMQRAYSDINGMLEPLDGPAAILAREPVPHVRAVPVAPKATYPLDLLGRCDRFPNAGGIRIVFDGREAHHRRVVLTEASSKGRPFPPASE